MMMQVLKRIETNMNSKMKDFEELLAKHQAQVETKPIPIEEMGAHTELSLLLKLPRSQIPPVVEEPKP